MPIHHFAPLLSSTTTQQHLSLKVRVEYSCGSVEYTTACSTLFIYMVESWVKGEHINKQSTAYVKDPDTPVRPVGKGKKDKQWVGMASVAFANSTSCLRVELMEYLGDKSGDHGTNTSVPFV